ncbi:PLP-dependent aminotransferase family protein [Rhizobium sp. VS19-DR104.2]|uniref:aminotransferase-like domain-containing protein n=1 Tax=unclassified Rhizobium TaxID=2613769 RepID=UPI001CC61574|nr:MULTISPECIES: PLP-dependent aminotransferase family protein [unclassified Rhizobium]MBZ5763099.1 PLP-dependent aminotransferase family protein [Rhizobium sp. VS19-DR96]MBZ5769016.1 PLP-dependent aminotransferase family protein [Rhizobium sp. VS19-DR129.2]MBZ5776594.1 PLP-dependent aminotransferase family protein [Rhizobium sp. VS19-DRK62.2]MBZ5787744.1 PLP-dependent aminotransferase family protein [Rhizobium sp. VS19-DR121]MBZ5805092.1 PLP-dependent aminotransferase family protein [Rhizobiu
MSEIRDAIWLAEKITDRTIRGIAIETSALIRGGALPVGTKLPAIRDLAFALGISPATISEAWSELRRQKIISGRGRNGTWVRGDRFIAKPERLASSGNYGMDVLNLTAAVPDIALLPKLTEAMVYGASAENLNSYERSRILPELEAAVRETWPYQPEAFLATNGGYNAVYTMMNALVMPGDAVAIENPTAMRLLDILEDRGARIVPVECDRHGPLPASLEAAMKYRPVAFVFQPRVHSVTGQSVSAERMSSLAEILRHTDTLIVEDDGVADIADQPQQSLGHLFPERVIHILSFSKTHGPDLRLAVLSSSQAIVEQIQSYRSFSAGWTSRILQAAGAWLIRDPATQETLQRAKAIYAQRRGDLVQALQDRNIDAAHGGGLCAWVPVSSEAFAMVTLAARGIAVYPGAKFSLLPGNYLRVATATLSDRCIEVADAIALGVSHD